MIDFVKNLQTISGLKIITILSIQEVFSRHVSIKEALLYGSRAMGTHKLSSDIDLVLYGENLRFEDLLRIENELDDLLLP